jgi:hypothetical protein
MPHHPAHTQRGAPHGRRRGLQVLAATHIGEQGEGRSKGDEKAKAPVLCDAHQRSHTLRRLRTVEVHKSVEEDLFGQEYGGKNCEARGQTESKSRSRRRCI